MKLKSAVLLSSALVSTAALAQGTAPAPATDAAAPAAAPAAAAPATAAAPVNKTLVPYGLLQGYVNLTDSTRQNVPDFAQYITRLGLKVSEGIAKGQIELEVNRNNVGAKTISKDPTKEPTQTTASLTVRRADAGLDLATKTSVRFGRYRLGNPEVWGVDATSTLDGFGGSDGVMLSQGIDISEGNTVTVKAGVANALSVPAADNYQYGSGVDFNVNTSSKALLAAVDAKIAGVSAGVYYGIDGNWKQGNAGGEPKETSAGLIDARRVQHLEASLGYNIDGLGGGVAYQQISRGEIKRYTNENGRLKSGAKLTQAQRVASNLKALGVEDSTVGDVGDIAKTDGKVTESLISIGVNGDSSLFGLTDLAQTGDKLTYGGSIAFKSARNDDIELGNATLNAAAKDALENSDITEFAIGAGYNVGGFTLELDYALEQVKKKTEFVGFSNAKGDKLQQNRHRSYITSVYVF